MAAATRRKLKFDEALLVEGSTEISGAAVFISALIVPPTSGPTLSIWLTSLLAADGEPFTFVSTVAEAPGALVTETSPQSSDARPVTFDADVKTSAACVLSGTVMVTSTFMDKRLAPKR